MQANYIPIRKAMVGSSNNPRISLGYISDKFPAFSRDQCKGIGRLIRNKISSPI